LVEHHEQLDDDDELMQMIGVVIQQTGKNDEF